VKVVIGHGKKKQCRAAKFQTTRSSWVPPLILKSEFRGIVRPCVVWGGVVVVLNVAMEVLTRVDF